MDLPTIKDQRSIRSRLEEKLFDRAIIACTTSAHDDYCQVLSLMKKPYLCEKPLSKNIESLRRLLKLSIDSGQRNYVVNNFDFIKTWRLQKSTTFELSYNYYNTGNDGFLWDMCQLIHIAKKNKPIIILTDESVVAETKIRDILGLPFNAGHIDIFDKKHRNPGKIYQVQFHHQVNGYCVAKLEVPEYNVLLIYTKSNQLRFT